MNNLQKTLASVTTAARAMGGDAAINAGYGNVLEYATGDYLNPATNPYLQQNVQTAMNQAMGKYQFPIQQAWCV